MGFITMNFSTIWGISLGFFVQPPDVCILMVVNFLIVSKGVFLNLKLHPSGVDFVTRKKLLKAATGASESNGLSMLVREAQLVATGLLFFFCLCA